MATKRIELQAGTVVEITGHEDLAISGVDEAVLVIQADGEEADGAFNVAQEAARVTVELYVDAHLEVWKACPVVLRESSGDLSLRGVAGAIEIVRAHGDVALTGVGEVQAGSMDGDLTINRGGAVRSTGSLNDDVSLRNVGTVELTTVCGDLHVHRAASLGLERVEDDLVASNVAGDVRLRVVQGDASLRNIDGAVEIGRVEGDLHVHDARGDLAVTRVQGDVHLDVAFQPDRHYTIASQGDITVRAREGLGARFHIQSPDWQAPAGGPFQVESQEGSRAVVRLGDGAAEVHLTADGDVILGSVVGDWDETFNDFGRRMEEWGNQFGRQMETWGEQLRQQMAQADWEKVGREVEEAAARVAHVVESRMQEIDVEEMRRRAAQTASAVEEKIRRVDWERIGRKVDEATRLGVERMQAGLERLQRRMEHEGLRVPPVPPVPPMPGAVESPPPAAPGAPEPVTDEERMAVLRLVEEGRLSAEEAAALLEALDKAASS